MMKEINCRWKAVTIRMTLLRLYFLWFLTVCPFPSFRLPVVGAELYAFTSTCQGHSSFSFSSPGVPFVTCQFIFLFKFSGKEMGSGCISC